MMCHEKLYGCYFTLGNPESVWIEEDPPPISSCILAESASSFGCWVNYLFCQKKKTESPRIDNEGTHTHTHTKADPVGPLTKIIV